MSSNLIRDVKMLIEMGYRHARNKGWCWRDDNCVNAEEYVSEDPDGYVEYTTYSGPADFIDPTGSYWCLDCLRRHIEERKLLYYIQEIPA